MPISRLGKKRDELIRVRSIAKRIGPQHVVRGQCRVDAEDFGDDRSCGLQLAIGA